MRIDDENKVVWCGDWLVERLEVANFVEKTCLGKIKILSEYTLSGYVPETYEDKEWEMVIKAIFEDYSFKLEKPQKYYWRKKKEHLVWFEDFESVLIMSKHSKILRFGDISSYDNRYFEGRFTEQEARDLLKDDFDKFEKVEKVEINE